MTKRLALLVGTILTVIGGASTRFKIILLKNHLEIRIARQMAAAPIKQILQGTAEPNWHNCDQLFFRNSKNQT